ncbi:MAG: ABC transporter permease [Dehalococcoidia bacterium]
MTTRRVADRSFSVFTWAVLGVLTAYISLIVIALFLRVNTDSYGDTLLSGRALSTIRLSVICATIASVLALLFAVPTAYQLARKSFLGKSLVDTILDIPIILSPVALGTALLVILSSDAGRLFQDNVVSFTFATRGIILAQFSIVVALAIRSLKAVFEQINPRYEEVAYFLGCNRWQTFLKISLPLAKNGIIASFILAWARAVGEFGATITVAGAVQGKTETIPSAIYLGLAGVDIQETLVYVLLLVFVAISVLLGVRLLTAKRSV